MEPFSIPEQMDPLARAENRRGGPLYPEKHRQRVKNPSTPRRIESIDSNADGQDGDLDEDIHSLDEQA